MALDRIFSPHLRPTRGSDAFLLRAQRERRTDTALNTVSNSAKNCVLALPPDALLCVARCSAHAACAPDIMLKRYDVLQHVGRSR